MDEITPWWMAGSAIAGAALLKALDFFLARRKERTETDANIELLNGLVQRVKSLEDSQAATSAQLAEEMKLRMLAQEEAHRLRLRVMTLESAMRQVGAVIPPEPH